MSSPNPDSTTASNATPKPSSNSRPRFRRPFQQTHVAKATGTNPVPQHPGTRDITVESETSADKPDRYFSKGLCATPAQRLINRHSLHPIPDALPFKRCDTVGQSETFADVPDHNLNSKPRHARGVRSPNPRPMSDPLLSETCKIRVESETFADTYTPNTPASPAHRPASDVQLLTSNSQLLVSTPPPRRTCDDTGQSETFADTSDRNRNTTLQEGVPPQTPYPRPPSPHRETPAPNDGASQTRQYRPVKGLTLGIA